MKKKHANWKSKLIYYGVLFIGVMLFCSQQKKQEGVLSKVEYEKTQTIQKLNPENVIVERLT